MSARGTRQAKSLTPRVERPYSCPSGNAEAPRSPVLPSRARSRTPPPQRAGTSSLRTIASVSLTRLPLTPHGTPGRGPTSVPTPPRTPPPGTMLDAWELPGPPKTVDIGTVCIPAGKILHREQPGEGKSMPTTPSTTPRVEASAESVLRAAGRILQREEPGPGEGKSMPNTPSTTPRLEASAEPVLRASGKILQKEQPAACKSMPTTPRVEHAAPV
eukprot:2511893-Amphidinium_carterae.1